MPRKREKDTTATSTTAPSVIMNSVPEGLLLPLAHCHPQLLGAAIGIMTPGTAFQLLIGDLKVVRGVFISATEWYVEGQSRPYVQSLGNSQSELTLNFKNYPGSHIPDTRSPGLFATMMISRIQDDKAFHSMVCKMDSRILHEIQRRCPSLEPEPAPFPVSQFHEVVCPPFGCDACHRSFSGSIGLAKHKCEATELTTVPPPCTICGKRYSSQRWLEKHMVQFHATKDDDNSPFNALTPLLLSQFHEVVCPPFGCEACHRGFSCTKGLAKHKCEADEVLSPCTICGKQISTPHRLEKHIAKKHGGLTSSKIPMHFNGNQQQAHPTARPQVNSPFRFEQFSEHHLSNKSGVEDPDESEEIDDFTDASSANVWQSPFTFLEDCDAKAAPTDSLIDDPLIDDEEEEEDEVRHTVMPSGLTSMEILALADGWNIGQEFMMEYKMRPGNSGDVANLGTDWKDYDTVFMSRGMLYRWEFTGESPGPIASYVKVRKKTKYEEEYLDCTEDCIVLSINQVPQSAMFDRKRRKIMREEEEDE